MIDLIDEGRALLALADAAHEPSEADRVRVRAALAARLGAAAGLGIAAGIGASAAKTAIAAASAGGLAGAGATTAGTVAVGSTLAVKLIGAIVLAATVAGSAAAIHHARRPLATTHEAAARPTSTISATRHTPLAGMAEPAHSSQGLPDQREEARPAAPEAMTGVPQRRARRPARRTVTTPAPVEIARSFEAQSPPEIPAASFAVDPKVPRQAASRPAPIAQRPMPAVDGEARLIGDGVSALRAGEPARALALFEAHARHYPRGVLAEERDFERALALAALGRHAQARFAADEFLRAHPTSPLATRLRRTIPGSH
jgi:hypothetical protein